MNINYKQKDQPFNNASETHQLRVQTEQYQNLAMQVLELINQNSDSTDLIKGLLFLIKVTTGFEAVGTRLREGEDFPYYETIGFSKDFLQGERYLCSRDQNGELIRDSKGNPYLECMCGNVICKRTDPSLPFFTEGGSFWTNSTTELLASTNEDDRQGRTRNRCNGEGYESVALIPLRYDKKIIGLLQFNDSRKNLFTPNVIRFLEGVGSSIGIALKIKQKEDSQRQFELRSDSIDRTASAIVHGNCNDCNLFQYTPVSIWEEDFSDVKAYIDNLRKRGVTDFRTHFADYPEEILSLAQKVKIVAVNKATLQMFKAKNEEELYRGLPKIFNKDSFDIFREELIALSKGKTEFESEAVNLTLTGEKRNILLKLSVPPGYENTLSKVFVSVIDISHLKRLESQGRESEKKYGKIFQEAPDTIMVIDAETGIIRETNKEGENLFGLPEDAIVGMHFTELCPHEKSVSSEQLFHQMQKGRFAFESLVVCRRSSEKIPVSVSSGIVELRGKKSIPVIIRPVNKRGEIRSKTKGDYSFLQLLTQRECEILKLIARGFSAGQIAGEIYVSEKTVRKHRENIMKKLNVRKTADLVRYAIAGDLFDPEPSA